jgi:hypothetical protein
VYNNAIQLQHESYRDGVKGGGQAGETVQAAKAHTEMALRMAGDKLYGLDFLFSDIGNAKDALMYSMALALGDEEMFLQYVDSEFDSSADYARRYENWEKTGKIGVQPGDGFAALDNLFEGFTDVLKLVGVLDKGSKILTEQPKNDMQLAVSAGLTLLSVGMARAQSVETKDFMAKSLIAMANIPLSADDFASNYATNALIQVLASPQDQNYYLWHNKHDRDTQIFNMAKKIGIELSVNYETGMTTDLAKRIEEQMVQRYYTLGNLLFNKNIKDEEEIKMLMYGGYLYETVPGIGADVEGHIGITANMYQFNPGYLWREEPYYRTGQMDWQKNEWFVGYTNAFKIVNDGILSNQVKYNIGASRLMNYDRWMELSNYDITESEAKKAEKYASDALNYFVKYQNLLARSGR